MFSWKSQTCIGDNSYKLQIETDDHILYEIMEKVSQLCIELNESKLKGGEENHAPSN